MFSSSTNTQKQTLANHQPQLFKTKTHPNPCHQNPKSQLFGRQRYGSGFSYFETDVSQFKGFTKVTHNYFILLMIDMNNQHGP